MEKIFEYCGIATSCIITVYLLMKYFSQKLFENYLQKEIETHKSELEKLNISYQIKFSSLHVERAEIIKNLYESLYDYKMAIIDFFDSGLNEKNPYEHLQDKLNQWTKSVIQFSTIFHKNKIFFPVLQVELINSIDKEMNKINDGTRTFLSNYRLVSEQINAIQNKSLKFLELKKESDKLLEESMLLEKELEEEFRVLLGVELKK